MDGMDGTYAVVDFHGHITEWGDKSCAGLDAERLADSSGRPFGVYTLANGWPQTLIYVAIPGEIR